MGHRTVYKTYHRILEVPVDFSDVLPPSGEQDRRRKEAEMAATLEDFKEKAKNKVRENEKEGVEEGEIVYRVYGPSRFGIDNLGKQRDFLYGQFWTNLNPLDAMTPVPTNPNVGPKSIYRILAGLPNANTGAGTFLMT